MTQTTVRSVSTDTHADTGVTWRNAWLGRSPAISTMYQPFGSGSGKRIVPPFPSASGSMVAVKEAATGSPAVGMSGVEKVVQRGAARKSAQDPGGRVERRDAVDADRRRL